MNSRRHLNIMKHLEILKPKLPSRWTSHHIVLSKKMKTTCLERSVVLCHSHSSAFFLDNMASHREVYYVLSWLISFLFLTLKFYWVTFVFFLENFTPLYWDRYCLLLLSFFFTKLWCYFNNFLYFVEWCAQTKSSIWRKLFSLLPCTELKVWKLTRFVFSCCFYLKGCGNSI